ncbi:hypothetical protein [Halorubrum laminariae]|uniref:Uncharacterized protein n=1 Tax=Halorubrum laminariae TaxID=1433523 RepID=A0ABD6BZR9_9EURY|nr:hypothetical protein [Halorubrum laminariae]
MSGELSRFTSDRRSRNETSWVDGDDWDVGTSENVDVTADGLVGRAPPQGSDPSGSESYTGNGTTTPGDVVTIFSDVESVFESGYIEHGVTGQTQSKIEVQDSAGSWFPVVDPDNTNRWVVEGTYYGVRLHNGANYSDYGYEFDFAVQRV